MKNPLDSIKGTLISGVVLMFVIIAILDLGEPDIKVPLIEFNGFFIN